MPFVPTGSERNNPPLVYWSAGNYCRHLFYIAYNLLLLGYIGAECTKLPQPRYFYTTVSYSRRQGSSIFFLTEIF